MKAMLKLWMALVLVVAVMAAAVPSWADQLMPDFPNVWTVGQAVAGQSKLVVSSGSIGRSASIYVDWIVVYLCADPRPVWGYYYQIENYQVLDQAPVRAFIIESHLHQTFGIIQGRDLDRDFEEIWCGRTIEVRGHTARNYPNLIEEYEPPAPGVDIRNPDRYVRGRKSIEYYFNSEPLDPDDESTILCAYSFPYPPTYGPAKAANDANLIQATVVWEGRVPVPSPEPGTVVLLILGTIGVGFLSRRYRRK